MTVQHEPVLIEEALSFLSIQYGDTIVDATVGSGGHAARIIQALDGSGHFIGIDTDLSSLERTQHAISELATDTKITLIHGNFRNIESLLHSRSISGVDGILADLGWSMDQFSDPARGFSFQHDGPLDMRLDPTNAGLVTAYDIVNVWERDSLVDILKGYGEERFARRIAVAIVDYRNEKPITTTKELVSLIESVRPRTRGIHPATQTFQALRITANDELGALDSLLASLPSVLNHSGRVALISFHSLEDRRIKRAFRTYEHEGGFERLTKKGITPSESELLHNPRSRSARLRALKRL